MTMMLENFPPKTQNMPVGQSVGQSVGLWVGQLGCWLVGQLVSQSLGLMAGLLVGQDVCLLVRQLVCLMSASHPVGQIAGQLDNQLVSWSAGWSTSCRWELDFEVYLPLIEVN